MASPTSAKEWKKATAGEEVELPSGNVALIRRPGMESLFAAGVLPDELTKMALEQIKAAESLPGLQGHMKKGQKAAQESITFDRKMLEKFMSGENAIQDMFEAFDRITALCVVSPPCQFHKQRVVDEQGHQVMDENDKPLWGEISPEDRDEEVLYTDEVDIDDKTFIFNFVVGGTRDLSTFREEFSDALADVQPREDVELPTESTDQHPE